MLNPHITQNAFPLDFTNLHFANQTPYGQMPRVVMALATRSMART